MLGRLLATVVACTTWALILAPPANAHHSFTAEFDSQKPVEIEGVISKSTWVNPHSWLKVVVKDPKTGKVEDWDIQTESPAALRRAGMTRETMGRVGDRVHILAFGARDGTNNGIIRTMTNITTGAKFQMLADFNK